MADHPRKTMTPEAEAKIKEVIEGLITLASDHYTYDWVAVGEQLIHRTHRTHQQRVWKLIYDIMERFGSMPKQRASDVRNETSWEFCHDVTHELPPFHFPFI